MYYLGVDIGGTFTDCVAVDDEGRVLHGKALSTHATTPADGVVEGLGRVAEEAGITVGDLLVAADRFSHGTTIGTNQVVERNGARVGLLATRGHADALLMMRGNGRTAGVAADLVYSVHATDKPRPLVPRRLTAEVSERIAVDGTVLSPLDEDQAREAIATLLERGAEAIAIALIWGFRNPVHERRLRELVREQAPDAFVSLSSETSPRQGEYERTVATVINSYVGPASGRYLDELAMRLTDGGLAREPFIMQSNGGVVPVGVAQRFPVQTIGSGPAGGLAGTLAIAATCGHRNVIATDMGGTSFEVGLVVDGRPVMTSKQVLDQYTFQIAQYDLRSIACGGGSIAHVDEHSSGLRVGPRSAGSDPGPACYGKGTQPTVTDADVVLGILSPDEFLGGRMQLDRAASERAVQGLADQLGLGLEDAAAGILRVNSHNAATLIRQRTIAQGLDPRDFVVYAFGGAGPVHAFSYAKELRISEVVVPLGNGASTLSAYGIAASDVARSFERETTIRAPFDAAALQRVVDELDAEARDALVAAGFDRDAITVEMTASARYAEQFMQDLPLSLPDGPIDDAVVAELGERFVRDYRMLYGDAAVAVFNVIEIFTVRATATVPLGFAARRPTGTAVGGSAEPRGHRDVYWPDAGEWVRTAVHDGRLPAGAPVDGPAIVQLPHTTVSVAPGQRLVADDTGNLVLSI